MNERRRDYLPEDPIVTRSDNVSVLRVPKGGIDTFAEIHAGFEDIAEFSGTYVALSELDRVNSRRQEGYFVRIRNRLLSYLS